MPYVTVGKENGENIDSCDKAWGKGQPIVFSHGWPLSADDWDPQLLFSSEPHLSKRSEQPFGYILPLKRKTEEKDI